MACSSPYYKKFDNETIPLPCGKCGSCKIRRVNQWVFRLRVEAQKSASSHFVTLTYNNKNLPRTPNGYKTLESKHLTDFFKRLRYYEKDSKIRYFACGEYGTNTSRPHYHIILFNLLDKQNLLKAWEYGNIDIGLVEKNSIAYVLKYIDKEKKVGKHQRDDRKREFQVMSKGLGKDYLTPAQKRYHRTNPDRNYVMDIYGNKIPLPRYYVKEIYKKDPAAAENRKKIIKKKVEEIEQKHIKRVEEDYKVEYLDYKNLLNIQKQRTFERKRKLTEINKRNKI